MKRLLIVGAGGHGRSVAEAVLAAGKYELVGFVDDAAPSLQCVWDLPVFGATTDLTRYGQYADVAIVAIGNNRLREEFQQRLHAAVLNWRPLFIPRPLFRPGPSLAQEVPSWRGPSSALNLIWAQASSLIAVQWLTTNAGLKTSATWASMPQWLGARFWGVALGCRRALSWVMASRLRPAW